MRVIQTKIGDASVLIEAISPPVELEGIGRATKPTGIPERLENAYANAKSVIKTIAADLGRDFNEMISTGGPDKVELEVSLGLSAETGLWIITAKGDCVLKVKFSWELRADE